MNGNDIFPAADDERLRGVNVERGRFKLRHALREVVSRIERDVTTTTYVSLGSWGMAKAALAGREMPGQLPVERLREVYVALNMLMHDVVKHALLDPADPVYLTAMDAMAACVEG